MNAWMTWLAVAAVVVIVELFTGTFYLLMISLGLLAGALVAVLGMDQALQMISAAIIGALATLLLHKSKYGWRAGIDASRDPNVNMDIGQSITVQHWKEEAGGKFTARAMYRGAMWDVELQHSSPFSGVYVIEEIQGSRLIVRPA